MFDVIDKMLGALTNRVSSNSRELLAFALLFQTLNRSLYLMLCYQWQKVVGIYRIDVDWLGSLSVVAFNLFKNAILETKL